MDFGLEQYDLIAEKARTIKGKMLISVNNIPEMKKAFKGLKMTTVGINYSVGSKCGQPAKREELLIRNF